ncbi:MAG: hypothetical protein JO262_21150, partial [Solirubrobacterales bacterium]|nr:hypothetical protein [Solirubrobacterales bacterium]
SSIFIASPVLTHWKEREPQYRHRRERIEADLGYVPAYAATGADVEPAARRRRRVGRLTTPDPDSVSAAEFEQMKRDLDIQEEQPARRTSTLTKRLAHTEAAEAPAPAPRARQSRAKPAPSPRPASPAARPTTQPRDGSDGTGNGAPRSDAAASRADEVTPAPDIPENEGVAPAPAQKRPAKTKSRNRRHGRRR